MEDDTVKLFLNLTSEDQYLDLDGIEFIFHEAKEHGLLYDVLKRFPDADKAYKLVNELILNPPALPTNWLGHLKDTINALIALIAQKSPQTDLMPVTGSTEGIPDYNTDEMFEFSAEMRYLLRDHKFEHVSLSNFVFLDELFYGIDCAGWPRWSMLQAYSDLDIDLSIFAIVARNNIEFAIHGNTLVYQQK